MPDDGPNPPFATESTLELVTVIVPLDSSPVARPGMPDPISVTVVLPIAIVAPANAAAKSPVAPGPVQQLAPIRWKEDRSITTSPTFACTPYASSSLL